jgi:V/A-type H+-transporting ATPase subunit A
VLWGGRLLREGFLQQSALSTNDAYCSSEKTRALLEAILRVVEACHTAVQRGVTASEIEELDYSALLRAGDDLAPDDVAGVAVRRDHVLAGLEGLR